MSATGTADESPRIEAIDRALMLLEELARCGPEGAQLTELSSATGISKATAYRALSTLRLRGFASQSPSGSYRLGPTLPALVDSFYSHQNLTASLRPALVEVSLRAQELVHLGAWDGNEIVYLDKVESAARAIRVWSAVGQRVPAASSALGRALLAARESTPEQVAQYLRFLPAGREVTRDRLTAAVAEAHRRGFSEEFEENEPGVACIGFAIMQGAAPVAALSITSLAERMTPSRIEELRGIVVDALPALLPSGLTLWAGSAA